MRSRWRRSGSSSRLSRRATAPGCSRSFPQVQAMDRSADGLLAERARSGAAVRQPGRRRPGGPRREQRACGSDPTSSSSDFAFFRKTVATRAFAVGVFVTKPDHAAREPQPRDTQSGCRRDAARRAVDGARPRLDRGVRRSQQLPPDAVMLVVDEAGIVLARSEAADQWVGRSVAASEMALAGDADGGRHRHRAAAWTASAGSTGSAVIRAARPATHGRSRRSACR